MMYTKDKGNIAKIRISDKQLSKLYEIARDNKMTLSDVIRSIIDNYISSLD